MSSDEDVAFQYRQKKADALLWAVWEQSTLSTNFSVLRASWIGGFLLTGPGFQSQTHPLPMGYVFLSKDHATLYSFIYIYFLQEALHDLKTEAIPYLSFSPKQRAQCLIQNKY